MLPRTALALGLALASSSSLPPAQQTLSQHAKVTIRRVDADHGDTLAAWEKMGKRKYPTREQIAAPKKPSEIGPAEVRSLRDGELTVSVTQKGLALIEIR